VCPCPYYVLCMLRVSMLRTLYVTCSACYECPCYVLCVLRALHAMSVHATYSVCYVLCMLCVSMLRVSMRCPCTAHARWLLLCMLYGCSSACSLSAVSQSAQRHQTPIKSRQVGGRCTDYLVHTNWTKTVIYNYHGIFEYKRPPNIGLAASLYPKP
jgi:hypothetical protein